MDLDIDRIPETVALLYIENGILDLKGQRGGIAIPRRTVLVYLRQSRPVGQSPQPAGAYRWSRSHRQLSSCPRLGIFGAAVDPGIVEPRDVVQDPLEFPDPVANSKASTGDADLRPVRPESRGDAYS